MVILGIETIGVTYEYCCCYAFRGLSSFGLALKNRKTLVKFFLPQLEKAWVDELREQVWFAIEPVQLANVVGDHEVFREFMGLLTL